MADKITSNSKYETKGSSKPVSVHLSSKDLEQLQKDVADAKNMRQEFMVILGIFAAVVAFLAVEVDIFKSAKTAKQALGFSCYFTAGLLSFLLLMRGSVSSSFKEAWISMLYPVTPVIIFLFWLGYHLVK